MAENQGKTTGPAPGSTAPAAARDREVMVTGRDLAVVPEPKHGDPTEGAPPAPGDTVVGVRVGSEASVEDGTDPVLPYTAGGLSEATKVRNATLRARDEREWRKRGMRSSGVGVAGRPISLSMEGLFVVERKPVDNEGDEGAVQFVSGSFTGVMPEDGLLIRPATDEEIEKMLPGTIGSKENENQRANDLVAGSGTGGGGNPMHAGLTRGTSDRTAERVGQGGVTSQSGPSPAPRPANAGAPNPTPQGGGTTSRGGR